MTWLELANAERRRREEEAARLAAARRTRLATAVQTFRQRSAANFDGSFAGHFIVPIRHKGISRGISWFHPGIDYRADVGTPVVAAADGRVIETTAGWAGGFGVSVLIDHGSGVTARYAHLSRAAVGVGTVVSQGQVIGYSGSTGRSTGPHLHFEVRRYGRPIYPF
jgi:murein DD-endopeptidase MepM/ murein hydrolase activator NlpD